MKWNKLYTHKETIHRDRGQDFFLRNDENFTVIFSRREENGKTKGKALYIASTSSFLGPG